MKITHLTTAHPADDNRIFKICRSIARSGRIVSYIVPADDTDHVVDGVAIKFVPTTSSRWERMLISTLRVYRRAIRERTDIYQFHDPELIPVGLALRVLHNRQVIYDVHENVPDMILSKSNIPGPLRRFIAAAFDRFERGAAAKFSAIVTANEDISERFKIVNERVVAIHNYAEAEEFCDYSAADESRYRSGLVFHSAASERTGFPAVLRAFGLMSEEVARKLVATGNTETESQKALKLAAPSSIGNRLELLGTLPRKDMAKIFSQCAVSLVLYSDPRNHSNIRANRFFESLAAAAPVIVSDFPEWRAIVESVGCGLPVDPGDPQAIADAIHYILTHPVEACEMGKRGRHAFLQSFNWTHESNKLLQLYDTLVPESQPLQAAVVTTT